MIKVPRHRYKTYAHGRAQLLEAAGTDAFARLARESILRHIELFYGPRKSNAGLHVVNVPHPLGHSDTPVTAEVWS